MSKWRKLWQLSWADRRLLLQAAVLLIYAKLRLPHIDFRADSAADSAASFRGQSPAENNAPSELEVARAQSIARLVAIASAHSFVRVACLHRSLALWWLLRRQGIRCDLRIGIKAPTPGFEAHAWVEYAGIALDDTGALSASFRPFARPVVPVGLAPPGFGHR
jgi:hypothetical protein